MNLREQWVSHCLSLANTPATFYSGARKIIRPLRLEFTSLDDSLIISDCGFTKSKLRMLERNYLVKESIDAALELWKGRVARGKYGSVGFTTYGHYVKGGRHRSHYAEIHKKRKEGDEYKPSRSSVMGPCIQSVVLTLTDKKSYAIDVSYRTTEFYKKFAADLVFLRDVLLKPFDFSGLNFLGLNCHFANVTLHPMYAVTIVPHLKDPVKEFQKTEKSDPHFSVWQRKWTARYLVPKYFRGIEKFSQAMRVRKDALERIDKRTMKALVKYLTDNHPGYRKDYIDPDEEETE